MYSELLLVSSCRSDVSKAVKARKIISSLLSGIGCIVLFVGLIGFILPRIDNPQLKLVLSSFQEPTSNGFLQLMNNGMNLAMAHCFPMLLIGSGILAGGVLMALSLRTDEEAQALHQRRKASSPYARPVAETGAIFQTTPAPSPAADNPFARPAAPTNQDSRQSNTSTGTNPYARPVGEAAAASAPAEENPFARYIPADALPKSTARRDARPAVTEEPVPSVPPAEEPVLPANEAAQPVEHDVYEAYHRPADELSPAAKADLVPDEPDTAAVSEEEPPAAAADTAADGVSSPAAPHMKEAPNTFHQPAPVSAPPPLQAQPLRPVIRSTFRNSTSSQSEPEETESVASGLQASPQPSPRIKSTMGRKR